MRKLNLSQRQVLIESARTLEDIVSLLKKRHTKLAAYGVLPRFVRALLDSAELALAEAAVGLVAWADGQVDDNGAEATDRAETAELALDHSEDFGN